MSSPADGPANRLAQESSPYLLQHAHNPVDWYPWGAEAFEAALNQDKPVLLSIGYSACHWCHVMERESFENESIADVMNRHFINIKVDREERPDVDAVYMNFVQMTTGSGGWPLTVFLTPRQVPFYGGTYFPPDDRFGRPGFPRLLESLADVYRNRRGELDQATQETISRLQSAGDWGAPEAEADSEVLSKATASLLQSFDRANGGFGAAPKFPSSLALGFLLRAHKRSGDAQALNAVKVSLDKMAQGGIYDQLGGGFHRYSVDERWLVPHFEKMLYDNALLVRLYLEAFQVSGDGDYRRVVEETLGWVHREMTHPRGGFFSALDADSEGHEGKYYVWNPAQTQEVLGQEDARIFNDFFDVSMGGNFEGESILHHRYPLATLARNLGQPIDEVRSRLDDCRSRLLKVRKNRVPPGLDDKVLASWNGMMLSALAEAAFVLDSDEYLEQARRNARFLLGEMSHQGRLLRTWKDGKAKLNAYLEDYALVAEGLIALYQAGGEAEWLEAADRLVRRQIDLFWDDDGGDFYFTSNDHEPLIVRQKEFVDNAVPSGNSVSCLNLLKLARLLDCDDYRDKARRLMRRTADAAARHPSGFGIWLQAIDFSLGPVSEFAFVGPPEACRPLKDPVRRRFIPNKVVAQAESVDDALAGRIPLLEGKGEAGRALAYLCRDFVCKHPASSPEELERQIEAIPLRGKQ